ncbi:exonuclease VIII [Salmonella enterica]|uniref:Exonuclease VIII n=2 Tax=Salmonella enterica TaxID=28901 RepID=A0A619HQP1_SALER|nr:exonuclease VIII [Salmonella enterica subsp. enterica serovar Java]EAN9725174.1 exonuclease VIII [Salmonella enterica]EBQ9441399.1 exonuclease VIII [Salmonella enterica subsp. enterica serovar Cerro]EBV8390864.1 exonuclease VIII [Salmonella enterica subsp. enterica serovar Virchow]EDQ0178981.1 exonuclease VIII [Salmonella enterica subsp. enterica serovar 4,[5],12:b:-]EDV9615636.1 exonuclease VIII [Salmonella enterica subsp. enterica serovar Paratyphi B]EEE5610766.1 exonuclease VIII [Salmon
MSDNKEDFALHCPVKNEEARKRLGIKAGFFWATAKKLSVAVSRCIAAMDDKGYDEDDFKKPVRVNFPVVNDLPPEGVFDTEFCNRYEKGGQDGITMVLIPGAVENTAVTSDTVATDIVTDSDDTADNPLPAYAYNVNGELMEDVEKEMSQPVSGLVLPLRYLAQCGTDSVQHQITPERLRELHSLEMDPDSRTGSILLALQNRKVQLEKLDTKNLHSLASYIGKVFPDGKQPQLNDLINFIDAFVSTDYIDRGLLVKEWQKGNRVSCINRTLSGANAGGGIQSDRKMPQTILGLEFEIALGLLARKYEFDIYSLPLEIELKANAIMNAVDDPEWLATRELFVSMPGGLDYSRACVIATVKTTPENLYESPFRHREYLNKVLTETDHATPDPLVVDIACGRSSMPMPMKGGTSDDEEKPQSAGAMADEPAASETMEPDTTEYHPDPQQVETESSVADDGNQDLREKFSEQLAAGRGDFVPGISDPDDPKWVHNDYSASNEGEKTEVATDSAADTADYVDHSEDFSNQHEPETNHSEPVADQNEPEMPEAELEQQSRVPDYIKPGIYFGVANEAYHAGPGVSKSQLDDIADTPAIYLWRKNAPVDTEKTKPLDIGTAFHCCTLEPDEFSNRFIIAPEFNRRTNDGKREEKAFQESCASSGKTIITAEEGRKLDLMRQSIMALPMGEWLLESVGFCESSIYWEDTETGLLCRCRPDKIIPEYNWIVDVKTTADIHKFKTAFYDHRYHVQDAFYSDGYRAEFGEIPTFVFLVVSTTIECGRYPVEIFMMGDDAKLAGQHEYHRNLKTLAECTRNNDWPTIKTLSLPRWAKENANV